MHRTVRAALVAILFVSLAGVASAHEFWIEVSKFHAPLQEVLHVNLRVGEQFAGAPVVRDASRFRTLSVVDPAGASTDIIGLDGQDPAGVMRCGAPGVHTVVYHGTARFIEHDAAKFDEYLGHDGLEHIIERRAQRGDSSDKVLETYSRCAKALVLAGEGSTAGFDRVIGLPLEIIAVDDPFASNGSIGTVPERAASMSFKVLFNDKPIEGVLVVAVNAANPNEKLHARTDEAGMAALDTTALGKWLVSCVHMVESTERDEPTPDGLRPAWTSIWASLTFERAASEAAIGGQ